VPGSYPDDRGADAYHRAHAAIRATRAGQHRCDFASDDPLSQECRVVDEHPGWHKRGDTRNRRTANGAANPEVAFHVVPVVQDLNRVVRSLAQERVADLRVRLLCGLWNWQSLARVLVPIPLPRVLLEGRRVCLTGAARDFSRRLVKIDLNDSGVRVGHSVGANRRIDFGVGAAGVGLCLLIDEDTVLNRALVDWHAAGKGVAPFVELLGVRRTSGRIDGWRHDRLLDANKRNGASPRNTQDAGPRGRRSAASRDGPG